MAATLPPAYAPPEPLSAWQSVVVLDAQGRETHRITLYVPTSGRCDQHAADVDGARSLMTATQIGRAVAGWICKRPSVALQEDMRRGDVAGC